MLTKMYFALGLWLLFGFFANFPTASSIQCYACLDYPGSKTPCKGSSAIQCESFFDSCITVKIELEFAGTDFDETLKNCYIAESPGCNQTYACELLKKAIAEAGGKLLECDITCCHTDRCNGPDEGEPKPTTPGPYPQSELKYYIETFRALLDEMEYIVDKQLVGRSSAKEYKESIKEVLNDFYAAITNEEEQTSNSVGDETKTSASELMKKLESKRERVKEVLNDFYLVITNEEEPDTVMDELKTNAEGLMKELETKRGQSKKKHAVIRQKKIEAKTYQILSEVMESLARMAAQKR